jgi:hypothetical protein
MLGYIISDKFYINFEEHEIKSFDILHKKKSNVYFENIFVIKNNKLCYRDEIINNACYNGHIQVLEWFKKSGYKFEYDKDAINNACENGHVQVLEWFKNSGYELKYFYKAINKASANGHIQILEWFKNSIYKFKYDKSAFDFGFRHGFKTKIIKILKFYCDKINVKKLIKWTFHIFIKTIKIQTNYKYLKGYKTIKFKTHNKYLKGYQKN